MVFEDFRGNQREVSWAEQRALAEPRGQPARLARGRARGPGGGLRAGLARDRGDVPRHLEARRDPALAVGALRGRGDRAPDQGLAAESDRHRRGQRRPHAGRPGRRGDRARRGPARRRRTTRFETVDTSADDPAQIYYTSGTTGLAKGILHAHRYILAHEEFVYCHDVQEGELFHGMGEWAWAAGICPLIGPWRYGAVQFVYAREGGFDPHEQLAVLSQARGDQRLHDPDRDALDDGDRGRRRALSAEVPPASARPASRSTPRRSAGSATSTASRCSTTTGSASPIRSAGTSRSWRSARARWASRCRAGTCRSSTRTRTRSAPGERGEICLRARSNPHYPLGYWNNPEAAEETFGGEWFHTKDAAERDEDGYFWYAGRADDVIISAGYRIGPFEVESACIEHPAVREAAAVASPDERRGNVVKAFIVLAEGQRALGRAGRRDQGIRARPPLRLRLSAPDRVRRRAAEDADRQDPPDRAARGRARAGQGDASEPRLRAAIECALRPQVRA